MTGPEVTGPEVTGPEVTGPEVTGFDRNSPDRSARDARFMAHALALGRRGLGRTWPNPAVGCVIVRDGRIVGRGRTGDGGAPHAEVVALGQAGQAAHGATAYVTLEPCAHHGNTGPCTLALIEAGVTRVVAAVGDPDARVAGRGFAQLRAAGIDVSTGVRQAEATHDHAGFFKSVVLGLPFVTLKLAMTLDGRIATAAGESRWITGPQARGVVHGLRASHDAVMIGGGTARADDPMLDVRGRGVGRLQPLRVVVSAGLNVPLDGKLAQSARRQPVLMCHAMDADPAAVAAWKAVGGTSMPTRSDGRGVEMLSVLYGLGAGDVTRVLCEGGGAVAASLLAAGLVDEIVVFTAGFALGADGLPGIAAMGVDVLTAVERFDLVDTRPVGADTLTRWAKRAP